MLKDLLLILGIFNLDTLFDSIGTFIGVMLVFWVVIYLSQQLGQWKLNHDNIIRKLDN